MKSRIYLLLFFALFIGIITKSRTIHAYQASDFHWRPPFTTAANEKPSISIIFDTSHTMNSLAYANTDAKKGSENKQNPGEDYNASKEYYGYFNHNEYYVYGNNSANNECFIPEKYLLANNPNTDYTNSSWSGNFLNWATMHKVDVARKILTGGVYNNSTSCFEVEDQIIFKELIKDITLTIDTNNPKYWKNSRKPTEFYGQIKLYQEENTKLLNINYDNNKTKKFKLNINYQLGNQERIKGVLDDFATKARFALFKFVNEKTTGANEHEGGYLVAPMSDTLEGLEFIKTQINTIKPVGQATPLAEALYTVKMYIENNLPSGSYNPTIYTPLQLKSDPFYFAKYDGLVSCTQQNVLMITGGESSFDEKIPYKENKYYPQINQNTSPYKEIIIPNGSTHVIRAAYDIHTNDLRTDVEMEGIQNVNLYTVFAFGKASLLLKHTSIFGGFEDKINPKFPDPDPLKDLTDTSMKTDKDGKKYADHEWNTDSDDYPDTYFEALTGAELEFAITAALDLATRNLMSGTAAAVTSQTRSGEGAVYQALFFPPYTSLSNVSKIAPSWAGQVHAFLLDKNGNIREDTEQNAKLDIRKDRFIEFQDISNSININTYEDLNENSILDDNERSTKETKLITELQFLWSTTNWLNNISNSLIIENRTHYNSTVGDDMYRRYIFTFADRNDNSVVDVDPTFNEVQEFVLNSEPSNYDSANNFYSYLTLFESKPGELAAPTNPSLKPHLGKLAARQVQYIRGLDVSDLVATGIEDPVRSRKFNNKTWRLGDIVYSSPTVVAAPAENYHILYNDTTYREFHQLYKNRRQVIYVGANDGMLHAFNAGFYDTLNYEFLKSKTNEAPFELGSELWAYVPYNLLPHLRWLMDPNYGDKIHVPYVDLKPRIFDARIFEPDPKHPHGWGTVLVAGMRFGGAQIDVDITKSNLDSPQKDRTMSSAYVVMDITDPESAPEVLAEIRMPNQGFTTCYPTVIPMSTPSSFVDTENQWYLAFGSGPATKDGIASSLLLDSYRSPDYTTSSYQNGHLYIVDLKSIGKKSGRKIQTFAHNGIYHEDNHQPFALTNPNSFITDPIAVDLDLGSNKPGIMKTDIVYYGTVEGNTTTPSGSLMRLITNNIATPTSATDWSGNKTLISTSMPITSAASIANDDTKRLWVYFGTGRFFNRGDIPQNTMTFFGVKEPISNATNSSSFSWATVKESDLYDSTLISLNGSNCISDYNSQCVIVMKNDGTNTVTMKWDDLLFEVEQKEGWRHNLVEKWERVLGQPAILGGAVLFNTYIPNPDICAFEGDSRLYALYYKTGTAYYKPILTGASSDFATFVGLGKGMSISPNLHIGEKSGSTAFIQTSTGAIISIDVENPISVKSGQLFWRKNVN